MQPGFRIVRRNGNLVTRLIGDLRKARNVTANPVHRQRANLLSLQQASARCGDELRLRANS